MAVTSTQVGGLILVGSIVLRVALLLLGVWSSRARPLDAPRRHRVIELRRRSRRRHRA